MDVAYAQGGTSCDGESRLRHWYRTGILRERRDAGAQAQQIPQDDASGDPRRGYGKETGNIELREPGGP